MRCSRILKMSDQQQLLVDWTDGIDVPKRGSNGRCKHCTDILQLNRRGHCRLCGFRFCNRCSAYFVLPSRFTTAKKGNNPVRVCRGCRNTCLAKRETTLSQNEIAQLPSVQRSSKLRIDVGSNGAVRIRPPVWATLEEYSDCATCSSALSLSKYSNCCVCGDVFCRSCVSAVQVPRQFERGIRSKDTKVCDECRFMICGGAQLIEEDYFRSNSNEFQHRTASLSDLDTLSSGQNLTAVPSNLRQGDCTVYIRWQNAGKPFASLHVEPHDTLEDIYEQLCLIDNSIAHTDASFLVNEQPVFEEHLVHFSVSRLPSEIVISNRCFATMSTRKK